MFPIAQQQRLVQCIAEPKNCKYVLPTLSATDVRGRASNDTFVEIRAKLAPDLAPKAAENLLIAAGLEPVFCVPEE